MLTLKKNRKVTILCRVVLIVASAALFMRLRLPESMRLSMTALAFTSLVPNPGQKLQLGMLLKGAGMKHQYRSVFAFILVFAFVLSAALRPSYACGPFSRYAIFSYTKHPDLPFEEYSSGKLGVVQASYARAYLYVAYRLMSGGSFDQKEQAALSSLWNQRLDYSNEEQNEDSRPAWLAARAKVTGIGPEPKLETYRPKGKDEYDSFLNCNPDAFKTAAKTLEERIARFGAGSSEVKEWTGAQDRVFANCGGGQTIPEESASTASPLIQADRSYQIAAAHFYAMNFDEARTRFERIAADDSSQWHEQAQYLVARSLIRKASLGDEANRKDALVQAEAQLKKVLSEGRRDPLNMSAKNLLNLVELRLRPEERIGELALSLMKTTTNDNLKQDLSDYTILLDHYTGDSDQPLDENLKKALDAKEKNDLTDWILTYQGDDASTLTRSVEKWQKSKSVAWLVACLSKIDAGDARALALMTAAERVESSSPGFATAQFHLFRLLIEKGDRATARNKLDTLLAHQSTLPTSAVNQFRHQRMMLATDFDEFLEYAQRQPAAFSWDDDGRENPIDFKDDEDLKPWAGRALLDVDSTNLLNERFPLSMLRNAAANNKLPEQIRRQFALAAWTRAAILDDVEIGKALVPLAVSLAPELKPFLNSYLSAPSLAQRQSDALYTILKFPGLRPYVESSTGRLTPIAERDIYRENWWCDMRPTVNASSDTDKETEEASTGAPKITRRPEVSILEFLTDAQAEAAKREHAQILALGTAPNYLAREVIEWANRTPNDPRVPEALHLAVTTTRYGCTDTESSKWSKAAFDLLHKRYPKTTWAKKTPYWFKDI